MESSVYADDIPELEMLLAMPVAVGVTWSIVTGAVLLRLILMAIEAILALASIRRRI